MQDCIATYEHLLVGCILVPEDHLLDWWFQTLLVVFHPKESQLDCSNYYFFVKATWVEKPPAVDVIAPGVD